MTVGLPTLPPKEPGGRSGRLWLAAALFVLVAGGAAFAWSQRSATETNETESDIVAPPAAAIDDTTARPPLGARIRVRVLNTSGVTGLARRATQHLRDYGFDVVDFGSGRVDKTADTRIAVHTGHPDWADRVKKALGVGVVVNDADSSRYIDLTIFVGRDWRPPAETLRP